MMMETFCVTAAANGEVLLWTLGGALVGMFGQAQVQTFRPCSPCNTIPDPRLPPCVSPRSGICATLQPTAALIRRPAPPFLPPSTAAPMQRPWLRCPVATPSPAWHGAPRDAPVPFPACRHPACGQTQAQSLTPTRSHAWRLVTCWLSVRAQEPPPQAYHTLACVQAADCRHCLVLCGRCCCVGGCSTSTRPFPHPKQWRGVGQDRPGRPQGGCHHRDASRRDVECC